MANDDIARAIMDRVRYVVLATTDLDGHPWASPVWFATVDYRDLFWVSYPGARHSLNIAAQPQTGLVVFDSTVEPGTGQAVYMTAVAERVDDPDEVARGLEIVSRASVEQGAEEFGLDQVSGTARLRLYRATVSEHSILDPDSPHDVRIGVL